MNELVSIIMPSYNTANYISDSINSILLQTYTNWELIIVDDCSTDNTDEIVKHFSSDKRITYIKKMENSGAAISRNIALEKAKGRWIAFLDSDDLWAPNKLEKQIAFMEANNYAFTFTDYRICLNGVWLPYIVTGPKVVNKRKMYDYCYFSTITVIYDSKKIGLIQIPSIRKNNDYAMWLKVIEKSNAYRLQECLSYYIKHDNSISSGSKIKLIKWHYHLFKDCLGKNEITSFFLTINNLIHGIWKKIHYKQVIKSKSFQGDKNGSI